MESGRFRSCNGPFVAVPIRVVGLGRLRTSIGSLGGDRVQFRTNA